MLGSAISRTVVVMERYGRYGHYGLLACLLCLLWIDVGRNLTLLMDPQFFPCGWHFTTSFLSTVTQYSASLNLVCLHVQVCASSPWGVLSTEPRWTYADVRNLILEFTSIALDLSAELVKLGAWHVDAECRGRHTGYTDCSWSIYPGECFSVWQYILPTFIDDMIQS